MSKKNEKVGMIKKIIIILAILISILVAVLCVVYFSDNNLAKMHITKINSLDKDYSDYIMPLNRNKMVNEYRGNMSEETMYTLIYEFALDVLPQFRNTLNEDIDKFYNDNKDYIYVKTGMENIEEYKAFVEKIKNLPEKLTLSKTEIKEGSVKKKGTTVYATLVIYYNDNSQYVEIDIKLENYVKKDRTSVVFK